MLADVISSSQPCIARVPLRQFLINLSLRTRWNVVSKRVAAPAKCPIAYAPLVLGLVSERYSWCEDAQDAKLFTVFPSFQRVIEKLRRLVY
jgi:hypothetical protein